MHRCLPWLVLVGCCCGCWSATTSAVVDVADETPPPISTQDKKSSRKVATATTPFRLPADESGKLLARVLPPTRPPATLNDPTPPARRGVPLRQLAETPPALSAAPADLARLPARPARKPLSPEVQFNEQLEHAYVPPEQPRRPGFPAGPRERVESEDVNIPPPLPAMATPVLDRVSTDDATGDASTAAVLAAPLPRREKPAPYTRLGVPEPYENRRPLTVSVPGEEMPRDVRDR